MNDVRPASELARDLRYAAARLAISRPTVQRLAAAGVLRTYRIGRLVRTTDAAIADAVRELERRAAQGLHGRFAGSRREASQ